MCGRPLGLKLDPSFKNILYFLDSYFGLFKYDLNLNELTLLSQPYYNKEEKIGIFNHLDIDNDNRIIYFSDSTSNYGRSQVFLAVLENSAKGRILTYNLNTKETKVLLSDRYFPNGVQLIPSKDALLFCETIRFRVMKYYLQGPKKGQLEEFVSNLPGIPDNIIYSHKLEQYFIGFGSKRSEPFSLIDLAYRYPIITKIVTKILSADSMLKLIPKYGIVLGIDNTGKIITNLQEPSGKIAYISEVVEYDGYLYMGSFMNPYMSRLKLNNKWEFMNEKARS